MIKLYKTTLTIVFAMSLTLFFQNCENAEYEFVPLDDTRGTLDAGRDASVVDIGTDTDGDGLTDVDEIEIIGTDPEKKDTDEGGVPDGVEVENGMDPLDPADDEDYVVIDDDDGSDDDGSDDDGSDDDGSDDDGSDDDGSDDDGSDDDGSDDDGSDDDGSDDDGSDDDGSDDDGSDDDGSDGGDCSECSCTHKHKHGILNFILNHGQSKKYGFDDLKDKHGDKHEHGAHDTVKKKQHHDDGYRRRDCHGSHTLRHNVFQRGKHKHYIHKDHLKDINFSRYKKEHEDHTGHKNGYSKKHPGKSCSDR